MQHAPCAKSLPTTKGSEIVDEYGDEIMQLCDIVRQTGFDLRKYHGSGQLEKLYEYGRAHRLRKQGIRVEQQVAIVVLDEDGTE